MGKKGRWIDASRLAQAGEQNAERLRRKLAAQLKIADTDVQLTCVYQGTTEEDAPLNCKAKVTYHWTLPQHGTVAHTTHLSHILYKSNGFVSSPCELKVPLLASCLPAAIQKNRIASMHKYKNDTVTVRHVALAKHYAVENYKTTFLTKNGRRVENLL